MIIRRLAHILIIVLLVTLQMVLGLWFGWATPELVFAGILALGLAGDLLDSWWWVGLGGLLIDLLSGSFVGSYTIIVAILSLILALLSRQLFHKPSPLVAFGIFIVFSLVLELVLMLRYGTLAWQIWLPALLTAMIASIFYRSILLMSGRREVIRLG